MNRRSAVEQTLRADGFRVEADLRSEKIGAKIRDAQLKKIPFMLVIGEREAEAGTVAVRDRLKGDTGAVPVAEFSARLQESGRFAGPADLKLPAHSIQPIYRGG
jgi:threonyl-tRNA synthetase